MMNILYFSFIVIVSVQGSIIKLVDTDRLVGGEKAPEGRIPYQVSLRDIYGSHFCGGTILNNRWVLTAAHCARSIISIRVVTGTNSLVYGGDKYQVERQVIHKDFDRSLLINDIALLKVKSDIVLNTNVQPIKLPEENTEDGANVMLSGWGTTSYPGLVPKDLHMINLTSISVSECQQRMQDVNDVHDSQICSLTKKGEGACHGDSGGPLVEGSAIVGVVSWGMPCARGYPDVYSRVYAFKDWILKNINDEEEF